MKLAIEAASIINGYRSNQIIMAFVKNEALERIATEISSQEGRTATAKAVDVLSYRHKDIAARIEEYITAGLFGYYLKSLGA